MCDILIFGGTTEGRLLAEFCSEKGICAYISVATDYGAGLLQNTEFVKIITGRMDKSQIAEYITEKKIRAVFDATHPYAVDATRNITAACTENGTDYYRIIRSGSEKISSGKYFNSIEAAINYLNYKSGNILVTTGSKTISEFTSLNDFRKRCAVRILPDKKAIEECVSLGFDRGRIIAGQGPFSEGQNIEHIQKFNAKYVVTKESGQAGGFDEKASAAKKCGAELIIISRPKEKGISLEEAQKILPKISKKQQRNCRNEKS